MTLGAGKPIAIVGFGSVQVTIDYKQITKLKYPPQRRVGVPIDGIFSSDTYD